MVLDGSKSSFEEFKHFFSLPTSNIWIISSQIENFEINPQMAIFMENRDFEHISAFSAGFARKIKNARKMLEKCSDCIFDTGNQFFIPKLTLDHLGLQ